MCGGPVLLDPPEGDASKCIGVVEARVSAKPNVSHSNIKSLHDTTMIISAHVVTDVLKWVEQEMDSIVEEDISEDDCTSFAPNVETKKNRIMNNDDDF